VFRVDGWYLDFMQALGAKTSSDRDLGWLTVWKAGECGQSTWSVRVAEHCVGDVCPLIQLPVVSTRPIPSAVVLAYMKELGPGDGFSPLVLKSGLFSTRERMWL
jgi:hypothetical protein